MNPTVKTILDTLNLTPLDAQMIPVCIVGFLVLWKVLSVTIFKPYLQLIEDRETATSGSIELAKKITDEAKAVREQYDTVLFEARKASNEERLLAIGKAREEAAKILGSAEQEARKIAELAKQEQGARVSKARSEVDRLASELSGSVVAKVNAELLQ